MKKIALFLMAAAAVISCNKEEFVPHVDFAPAEVTIPTAGQLLSTASTVMLTTATL